MAGIVLFVSALMAAQLPAPPDSLPRAADRPLPVSVSRIRSALERPPALKLTVPDPPPDFKVEIRQRPFIEDLLDRLDFGGGPAPRGGIYGYEQQQQLHQPEIAQPLAMFDGLALARSVSRAISGARRAHAEAAAREEVRRALAEFCASHECP